MPWGITITLKGQQLVLQSVVVLGPLIIAIVSVVYFLIIYC
jgi:hypothetical protein